MWCLRSLTGEHFVSYHQRTPHMKANSDRMYPSFSFNIPPYTFLLTYKLKLYLISQKSKQNLLVFSYMFTFWSNNIQHWALHYISKSNSNTIKTGNSLCLKHNRNNLAELPWFSKLSWSLIQTHMCKWTTMTRFQFTNQRIRTIIKYIVKHFEKLTYEICNILTHVSTYSEASRLLVVHKKQCSLKNFQINRHSLITLKFSL